MLLSGGVDSSVALHILQEQGHDITAFYLKIWLEEELSFLGTCPWEEDLSYVRAVCDQKNIPLEIISLQQEYLDEVVSYTLDEIRSGRTPNPDILCNQRIKFGAFYNKISSDFDLVATGHYANKVDIEDISYLYTAPDLIKDQTYFLSQLTQKQLKRAIFPIGNLCKNQVRELAEKINLPNKNRKDSQGICFLGKLKFSEFIKYHIGEQRGDLLEFETDKKVGEHNGFWYYTIGQRQGIGLGGGPWYVVKKDILNNIIYVSKKYHEENKIRDTFIIENCNWLSGRNLLNNNLDSLKIKMRHGPENYTCSIKELENNRLLVKLEKRDQGIAPGQFAVLYNENLCLGGGVIQYSFE